MTLRPQFSLIHSEFNEFLFASVGAEKNGTELTVLSALTRLGIDPWGEAARLSDLPREAAARALAAAIAALPEGDWTVSDSWAIAARLVDRLPGRRVPAMPSPRGKSNRDQRTNTRIALWLVGIMLAGALLFAVLHQYRDQAFGPVPSPVSSTLP
jgi:hypothetical protein